MHVHIIIHKTYCIHVSMYVHFDMLVTFFQFIYCNNIMLITLGGLLTHNQV